METTNLKFVETHAMNIPIRSAFNWFRATDKIQMLKFKDEDNRQRQRTQRMTITHMSLWVRSAKNMHFFSLFRLSELLRIQRITPIFFWSGICTVQDCVLYYCICVWLICGTCNRVHIYQYSAFVLNH